MIRFFAITTSLLMLFQSVNLHMTDLLELDELATHYRFHAEEYGDNFLVFLSKHYGELKTEHEQNHQEEEKEHQKLPFKHQCPSVLPLVFVPNSILESPSAIEASLGAASNFHYAIAYTSRSVDGPFHPPKRA